MTDCFSTEILGLQPDEIRRHFLVSLEKMLTLEPESLPFRQPVDPEVSFLQRERIRDKEKSLLYETQIICVILGTRSTRLFGHH
jgi:hypothetical protein